jgi:sulfur carrier protein
MRITVNGEVKEIADGPVTVRALVELLGLTDGPVAVERNGDIVPRAEHTAQALADGDVIEIVHFVGGG